MTLIYSIFLAYLSIILICTVCGAVIGEIMEKEAGKIGRDLTERRVRNRVSGFLRKSMPVIILLSASFSTLVFSRPSEYVFILPGTVVGLLILRVVLVEMKKGSDQ